jgi:hypothetical protein
MSYVLAAYLLVLGSVAGYWLQRKREIRRLRRALESPSGANRG